MHRPGSDDPPEDRAVLTSKDRLLEQAEENSLKGLNKSNASTPGILASVFEDDKKGNIWTANDKKFD